MRRRATCSVMACSSWWTKTGIESCWIDWAIGASRTTTAVNLTAAHDEPLRRRSSASIAEQHRFGTGRMEGVPTCQSE